METLSLLASGFASTMSATNLLACLTGCFLGTVVGILPGIGPSATVAMLIPVAYVISPTASLIMMLGVYAGAMYGGALTSILVNIPGEASSVMTAVDGYQMAKKGKGGVALVISQVGSFIGGTLSIIGLMLIAKPLAEFALRFGPSEYFALMLFALVLASTLVSESPVRGLIGVVVGLLIATVGTDLQTGIPRFALDIPELLDGIEDVIVIIGIFGVSEVLWFMATSKGRGDAAEQMDAGRWKPTREEWRDSAWPIARGTLVGFFTGVLAAGAALGSFLAYGLEKRVSKHPERFGKGAIEGVASCETANNASTGGALIPLLTLGIPLSGTTAVLLTVLLMYGLRPGPNLMVEQAPLMWTVIASMYVANVILLFLNLPAVGLFTKILKVPLTLLMPIVLVFASVGALALNNNLFDIALVFVFGGVGCVMRWLGFPTVSIVLGVVLGERLEQSLRQALVMSDNGPLTFVTKPIALAFILLTVALVSLDLVARRKGHKAAESA
jgi:putative tricarboxylic transport membrane protein